MLTVLLRTVTMPHVSTLQKAPSSQPSSRHTSESVCPSQKTNDDRRSASSPISIDSDREDDHETDEQELGEYSFILFDVRTNP